MKSNFYSQKFTGENQNGKFTGRPNQTKSQKMFKASNLGQASPSPKKQNEILSLRMIPIVSKGQEVQSQFQSLNQDLTQGQTFLPALHCSPTSKRVLAQKLIPLSGTPLSGFSPSKQQLQKQDQPVNQTQNQRVNLIQPQQEIKKHKQTSSQNNVVFTKDYKKDVSKSNSKREITLESSMLEEETQRENQTIKNVITKKDSFKLPNISKVPTNEMIHSQVQVKKKSSIKCRVDNQKNDKVHENDFQDGMFQCKVEKALLGHQPVGKYLEQLKQYKQQLQKQYKSSSEIPINIKLNKDDVDQQSPWSPNNNFPNASTINTIQSPVLDQESLKSYNDLTKGQPDIDYFTLSPNAQVQSEAQKIEQIALDQESQSGSSDQSLTEQSVVWDDDDMKIRGLDRKFENSQFVDNFALLFKYRYERFPEDRQIVTHQHFLRSQITDEALDKQTRRLQNGKYFKPRKYKSAFDDFTDDYNLDNCTYCARFLKYYRQYYKLRKQQRIKK